MKSNIATRWVSTVVVLLLSSPLAWSEERKSHDDRGAKQISAFVEHVDAASSLSDDQKLQIKTMLKDASSASPITDGLVVMYPELGAAIESTEQDNVAASIERLTPLATSTDPYLSATSSFYLARILMNNERFEQAIPLLERLTGDLYEYTVNGGEAIYFLAVAQAGMLKRGDAIRTFTTFLDSNPNAAERLRISAWRQIQELQAIEDGQLPDVQHHMEFSRRRLDQNDTSDTTQQKQDDIVKMLAKLIKEEEKKESNSSSKNSGKNQRQPNENPQAPQQSSPSDQNQSQSGGSSNVANGEAVDKTYDHSPASPWSRLRDRSRDPANNAIKEKLPSRYRDIVEKYYEAANGRE